MANYTPNLNLRKPLTTEKYDMVADLNDTKDKIDTHAGAVNAQLADIAYQLTNVSSGDDITVKLQSALNVLESKGGGKLRLPRGTFYLSIANSVHTKACILVPSNVTIEGCGMDATIIQRLPSERGVDGVLIANKNYDTATGYGACGNINFFDFTITDGATTPNRNWGDLIALGHGDNFNIQRVKGLNHDQHFVDICGCKNVTIRDCISINEVTMDASATYQIDQAVTNGIWGLVGDNTVSINITIENNKIYKSYANHVIHFHNGGTKENIQIVNNYIDGSYLVGNKNIIGNDVTSGIKNLRVRGNTFIGNDTLMRGINLVANEDVILEDILITENLFKGKIRAGIYCGTNTVTGASYPSFRNILIADNIFNTDYKAGMGETYAINTEWCKSVKISNNKIECLAAGFAGTSLNVILVKDTENSQINNNMIKVLDSTTSNTTKPSCIRVQISTTLIGKSLKATSDIANNSVYGNGLIYGINQSVDTATNPELYLNGIISGNNVYDDNPSRGHYYESVWGSCDGTNNVSLIDFGDLGVPGNTKVLQLASGQFYQNIPIPIKKGRLGINDGSVGNRNSLTYNFKMFYAPNQITEFVSDMEQLNFCYLSETTIAGTQIVDIKFNSMTNPVTNTFSLLTGVSGVSVVINNSTFQPVIRTKGYLMMQVGA